MNPPKDKTVGSGFSRFCSVASVSTSSTWATPLGGSSTSCWPAWASRPILGLVDGIMYLTKPEDVFQRCYLNWFCGEGPSAAPPPAAPPV